MKRYLWLAAAGLMVMTNAMFGQSMGWLQNSTGTYDYNNTANWKDGVINGVFGTNITSKSTQNITFSSDFNVTSNTFDFQYSGEVTFKFISDGSGAVKATLLDDIKITPSATKGSITFGSSTSGEELNFDLGGETRTVYTTFDPLNFMNSILDGELVISGIGELRLNGDSASVDDVVVENSTLLQFISSGAGATRANNLTLSSGILEVTGNSSADSTDDVVEDIVIDSSSEGGISHIVIDANSSRNAKLTAGSLVQTNGAIFSIFGDNLGDIPGANVETFLLDTAPTLVGGGGASGSTTMSIMPCSIAGISISDAYDDTLLTYDALNGFRPLDFATEYMVCSNVPLGTITAHNVIVPYTNTWDVTSDTAINSLVLEATQLQPITQVTGSGTLTVTSGMILIGYNRNTKATISCPLEFGDRPGTFMYSNGKISEVYSSISGTGGIICFQNQTDVGSAGVHFYGASTYSGDTYLHSNTAIENPTFLPSGSRTGNLIINGSVDLGNYSSTPYYINGLYGSGDLRGIKVNLFLGDNNSDGDFSGDYLAIKYTSYLTKVGTGTQIMSGDNTYNGDTVVEAGVLVVDGTHSGGLAYTVNDGGTLGGSGTVECQSTVSTAVTVEDGGILAPGSVDNVIGALTVSSNVVFEAGSTFDVSVSGSEGDKLVVNGTVTAGDTIDVTATIGGGIGPWMIMSATEGISANFEPVTSEFKLYKANSDTELWLEKIPQGSVFIIQ